ncbi:MAG: ABC transporter permease subunit [Acidimicrobiia bacterium]|nr:ABC transporter permease subunit [Acidimicrobiia bacterium]
MASMNTSERPAQDKQRVPLWRNVTFLKWMLQIVFLVVLVGFAWIAIRQVADNLRRIGLDFSWDFLDEPVGFQISEGIFINPQTGWQALFTGMVNMLRITISGIVAATILGVVVGIARLSSNALVKGVATVFVETIRNIPLLVQIIFWLAFVQLTFPRLSLDSGPIPGWLYVSRKGVSFAWLFPQDTFWQWVVGLIVAWLVARYVYRRLFHKRELTGEETHAGMWALVVFLAIAVLAWFANPVFGVLSYLFGAITALLEALPTIAMQLVLAGLLLFAAGMFIKRFLDSRRTPAGLAKLTDDDYFRLISAGVLGAVGAVIALVVPGIGEAVLTWGARFFEFVQGKFDFNTGPPLQGARPTLAQAGLFANYEDTGLTMSPGFFSVWLGVVLYTGAFIAEIVRGGILAVSKGQTEAGLAMGLRRSQLLRFIILPQAFRIILPPLGNQYLNLAKNTSLGVAVAFPEVVAVGQTVFNQRGVSVQIILFWMAFYLMVSLTISVIVNYFNRRLQLVER